MMTAQTLTRDPHLRDNGALSLSQAEPTVQQPLALTGQLYRFHGVHVVDLDGKPVGQVDWVWSNDATGRGTYIGVQLRWLRGTVRAIPAGDLRINAETRTIQVAYCKDQIKRAPRFAIDHPLTTDHQRAISAHYSDAAASALHLTETDGLAA